MEPSDPEGNPSNLDPNAFKLAVAVALLRFQKEKQQNQHPHSNLHLPTSTSEDADRWRKKAKERKRELIRLRAELEQLEDGGGGGGKEQQLQEVFSRVVSCSCHFFDECGDIGAKRIRLGVVGGGNGTGPEHWIDEVLRRRFLRHVRWNAKRKKSDGSVRCRHLIEFNAEDELEQLRTSVDFLVELSDAICLDKSPSSMAALSHLAIDFILASVKNLLSLKTDDELVEEITNGLIMRLTKRMCSPTEQDGSYHGDLDSQFCVQHLIRMLGSESYIGQRVVLSVSQRICVLAENLLVMDPFDDAFPDMHDWMFMLIQLIEFLISDNIQTWTTNKDFDDRLFEEWLRSVLQAHKALELLEYRNGLYVLYMERVTGELAKQLGPLSREGKLNLDILSSFLC